MSKLKVKNGWIIVSMEEKTGIWTLELGCEAGSTQIAISSNEMSKLQDLIAGEV